LYNCASFGVKRWQGGHLQADETVMKEGVTMCVGGGVVVEEEAAATEAAAAAVGHQ
jgi:hypothetical protein